MDQGNVLITGEIRRLAFFIFALSTDIPTKQGFVILKNINIGNHQVQVQEVHQLVSFKRRDYDDDDDDSDDDDDEL